MASARALYLPGFYRGPLFDAGLLLVRAKKMQVIMDGNTPVDLTLDSPNVRNVLRQVDVFLPNAREACQLTGQTDLAGAARQLAALGPVVAVKDGDRWKMNAAGPTTSIREEPYQAEVMKHFNLKGVIGKGGMGARTLKGCEETPGAYFHAIGGAASFIAQSVVKVLGVHKLEFGVPEAMWVIEVRDFPAVVTMDAHGGSQHSAVEQGSRAVLVDLLQRPY